MNDSEDRHQAMNDAIPAMAWSSLPDGSVEILNRRWLDFTGLALDEALGWGWTAAVHPDDLNPFIDRWRALLASGQSGEIEARLRGHNGEYRWFLLRAEPVRDNRGDVFRWHGVSSDIEGRKRAEALLACENRTLEMIAGGAPLTDILLRLSDTIDAQSPKIISTAMLMDPDGKRLWPVAGNRVPKGWIEAITPLTIGADVGSCGTAATLKQRVIVSDIANDPLWVDYRELALAHGLRAAWSQPLLSKTQELLGTF